MMDFVGWIATALFAASYLMKHPARLRVVQAAAAGVWIAYGIQLQAYPIIVANALVSLLAVVSIFRLSPRSATT